jgi:hypothetical protein
LLHHQHCTMITASAGPTAASIKCGNKWQQQLPGSKYQSGRQQARRPERTPQSSPLPLSPCHSLSAPLSPAADEATSSPAGFEHQAPAAYGTDPGICHLAGD